MWCPKCVCIVPLNKCWHLFPSVPCPIVHSAIISEFIALYSHLCILVPSLCKCIFLVSHIVQTISHNYFCNFAIHLIDEWICHCCTIHSSCTFLYFVEMNPYSILSQPNLSYSLIANTRSCLSNCLTELYGILFLNKFRNYTMIFFIFGSHLFFSIHSCSLFVASSHHPIAANRCWHFMMWVTSLLSFSHQGHLLWSWCF